MTINGPMPGVQALRDAYHVHGQVIAQVLMGVSQEKLMDMAGSGKGALPRALVSGGLALLLALLAISGSAWAASTAVITQLASNPSSTVWRIDTPDVKAKETSYPQITFAPGDEISVDAGGCVQTGGLGATWKRYVNPSGPNADRLYHGLIDIPGITTGPVRLQDYGLNTIHVIPMQLPGATTAQGLFLRLGYEDDGFSDNGYYRHDNGTGNQCKNVADAYVIVSVGHGVVPPPPSSFVGIPPSQYQCLAGWSFHNWDTSRLSFDTFKRAFDFGIEDYLDPATGITFLAARDNLASGGNCVGMSLLSEIAEDQFHVEDISEYLTRNYAGGPGNVGPASSRIGSDINTAHWQQLSAYFLHYWLASAILSPSANAAQIARDLSGPNYNYGLISIAHGSDGHVIVPIAVTRQTNGDYAIAVYDSNRPCTQPEGQVNISGDNWSFTMANGDVWKGRRGGDALAYIPYRGPDSGWRKLGTNFSGVVALIFGAGTQVSQVTDGQGRRLYLPDGKTLDTGAQSLSLSVFRFPMHGQGAHRPRTAATPYAFAPDTTLPPSVALARQQIEQEYASQYGGSGKVYLVAAAQLRDLSFQLSGTNARAMVMQGDEFFELRMSGLTRAPTITLHTPFALSAGGVSAHAADGKSLQAEFIYGVKSAAQHNIRIQHVAPLSTSTSATVRLSGATLQVLASGAAAQAQITDEVSDRSGRRVSQPRTVSIQRGD